jgi:Ca2+-transporting ATPase
MPLFYGHLKSTWRLVTTTLILGLIANLTLIVANLSWERDIIKTLGSENKTLWLVVGGALLSLVLVLYVPALRELFHFSVLHLDDLLIVFLTGILSVAWFKYRKVTRSA